MIQELNRNPVLGNIVLALIFGGGLLIFTLFVFAGQPQFWMFMGFSVMGMIVIFAAGAAHDQDRHRYNRTRRKRRVNQRVSQKRHRDVADFDDDVDLLL